MRFRFRKMLDPPAQPIPLPVSQGGTGSTATLGTGAIVFVGASGVFTGDATKLKWDNANGRLVLGASLTAQLLNLYESGNTRYGIGVQSGQLLFYGATGGIVSFGDMSTADGATFTSHLNVGSTGPFVMIPMSLATGSVGVESALRLQRGLAGGVSYPQVAEISVGRHTAPSGFEPSTRLDFGVKGASDGNLTGDVILLTLRSDLRMIQRAASSAPTDGDIPVNGMSWYFDEVGGNLKCRLRLAGGTYKTATLVWS
jgi:hypothetical protein